MNSKQYHREYYLNNKNKFNKKPVVRQCRECSSFEVEFRKHYCLECSKKRKFFYKRKKESTKKKQKPVVDVEMKLRIPKTIEWKEYEIENLQLFLDKIELKGSLGLEDLSDLLDLWEIFQPNSNRFNDK